MKILNSYSPNFNAVYCETEAVQKLAQTNSDVKLILDYANYKSTKEKISALPDNMWICADKAKDSDSVEFSIAAQMGDNSLYQDVKNHVIKTTMDSKNTSRKINIDRRINNISKKKITPLDTYSDAFMVKIDKWLGSLKNIFNSK